MIGIQNYDFVYDLNQVEVDVVGTGWTDYSSEFESTTGEGASYEGLPMGLMSYNHDVNGLTASIQINIDGQGYAHLSVTNVVFGQWNGQDVVHIPLKLDTLTPSPKLRSG